MRRIAITLAAVVAGVLVATATANPESALDEITVSTSNTIVISATQPYELRLYRTDIASVSSRLDWQYKGPARHDSIVIYAH